MTRKLRSLALAAMLSALAVAAGCSGESPVDQSQGPVAETTAEVDTTTAEPVEASGEPIVIGASLPLTGDLAEPGEAASRGYEVWIEMTNAAGGLLGRPVELVIKDDRSDQNLVVTDYDALIEQDGVDLLLGTSPPLSTPASAVAEQAQMAYVEPAGGLQQATAPSQADIFAELVLSMPEGQRPKTAAFLAADDPFGASVMEGLREQLEAGGVQTVYAESYPPKTASFDAIAAAIASKKPDVIAQGPAGLKDGVKLVTALEATGYAPKQLFQASAPSFGDRYADAIGVVNTEAIFYVVGYHVDAETPGNAEFVEAYRARFDEDPTEDAADAYAAAQVLQAAVEAVGSIDDQAALTDWLDANIVETILGPLTRDETGAPQQPFLLAQWQHGEEEIVRPAEASTSHNHLIPVKPPWGEEAEYEEE